VGSSGGVRRRSATLLSALLREHLAEPELAVQQLKESVEHSGANVVIESLPIVRANEEQLLRIFQNLIGNAIKYAGETTPEIHVAATSIGNVAVFSVRDNGIGIDPKNHDRIFDPFLRVHESPKYDGKGIGLATCKRIVQQYRGRIWVESKLGQGSTFYFTLPLAASDNDQGGRRKSNNQHGPGDQSRATGH
jgi:two-component system, chemotaxis family, sensor kinase Cph1